MLSSPPPSVRDLHETEAFLLEHYLAFLLEHYLPQFSAVVPDARC